MSELKITVIRSRRRTVGLEIKNTGEIILRAPLTMSDRDIKTFVKSKEEWINQHLKKAKEKQGRLAEVKKLTPKELNELAKKALDYIPKRVKYYAPLVGVTYGRITIRNQRTRWGSCSSKGNLNFNCLLMLAPPEVIDSVVVHELCHRKEMNHSKRFYNEVLRVFPEYYTCHEWLKKNGSLLMAMQE